MSQKPPAKHSPARPGTITTKQEVNVSWSGPLPPPEVLDRYNLVVPGFAERIVGMAENEAAHRHDQERRSLAADMVTNRGILVERRIGQVLAFIVALTISCSGAFLVYSGHPIAGTIFGGAGLAPVVLAFVPKKDQDLQRNNHPAKPNR